MGRTLKEADVTAVKKAAPSKSKGAAPASKAGTVAKKAPAAKQSQVTKAAPKKAAVAKGAPTGKKAAPAPKKAAPVPKKAAPVPKTAEAKKAAPAAPKKAAPVAPKKAPAVKKAAPAPAPPRKPTVGPYAKEDKFLEEQRVLLLEERGIYQGQAHDLRAEADSLALEREPGDVQFDEESGEGGTVTVDRERNLALSAQASAAVEEIDDALRKIDRKSYGACERCHQPIPKARLRALPFARLCVACKSGGLSRR
jgi:DnaK suppressor protein